MSPGDVIAQFDKVCEVQSDKATVDITSRYDGVIERLCGEAGDMVEVGQPLVYIIPEGAGAVYEYDVESVVVESVSVELELELEDDATNGTANEIMLVESMAVSPQVPVQNMKRDISANGNKPLATPAVRKLTMDYDLDLSSVEGTGKDGRVLKSDVLQELRKQGLLEECPAVLNESASPPKPHHASSEDEIVAIRGYNRIMVNAMQTTLQVPHMVYSDEVDMTALKQCRDDLKPLAEQKGVKISYLPFAVKACSLAMKEYPIMNSSIDAEKMTLTMHANHDIGVAIDSPKGLVLPVIRRCQDLSILDIALELNRLRDLVSTVCMDMAGPINAVPVQLFSLLSSNTMRSFPKRPIVELSPKMI